MHFRVRVTVGVKIRVRVGVRVRISRVRVAEGYASNHLCNLDNFFEKPKKRRKQKS